MPTITTFDPRTGDTLSGPRTLLDTMSESIAEHERAYRRRAERHVVDGVDEAMLTLDSIAFHWRDG